MCYHRRKVCPEAANDLGENFMSGVKMAHAIAASEFGQNEVLQVFFSASCLP